jgi:hypothetical protein
LLEAQMSFPCSATLRTAISRRGILAALPVGALAGASTRVVLAQPAAADPVSFYLGQVLALATLQAQAVGRLRPLLAAPAPGDANWLAISSAEAGVIGAVASVLGGMAPPPELAGSVGELRQASDAYRGAAQATGLAANGDAAALAAASAGLTQGATHILLWLDALTAETANDWGDGLRALTEAELPAATSQAAPAPVPQEVVDVPPTPAADAQTTERQARRKGKRRGGQS